MGTVGTHFHLVHIYQEPCLTEIMKNRRFLQIENRNCKLNIPCKNPHGVHFSLLALSLSHGNRIRALNIFSETREVGSHMVNVINHLSLIGQELEKQHRTLNLEHINLSLKRSLDKSNRTMENGHLMKTLDEKYSRGSREVLPKF